MSDELIAHLNRNMASLRRVTFQDDNGTTLKVLDSTERLVVLLNMLDHANSETGLVFVGAATIAKETGLDRRNVRNARAVLEKVGWLTPAGSVNYAGVMSKKLPGDAAKKGKRSPVKAYLVTLPGQPADLSQLQRRAVELPPSGDLPTPATGGNKGGNRGGNEGGTSYPPNRNRNIKPPTQVSEHSETPRSKSPRGEESKEGKNSELVEQLTDYLVQRDLKERPPTSPPGKALLRQKAADARPIAVQVAALPCADRELRTAERVAWAYYRETQPARQDIARLEGREEQLYFSAASQPPVTPPSPETKKLMEEAIAEAKAQLQKVS